MMKKYMIWAVMLSAMTLSCSKKEQNPDRIIAGDNSKIWKAHKETNAAGEKEKLSEEEKSEVLQFYSNGTFSLNGTNAAEQGKWDYKEDSKNLSLVFSNSEVSENFEVVTLKEEEIKLKASDGSTMTLASD